MTIILFCIIFLARKKSVKNAGIARIDLHLVMGTTRIRQDWRVHMGRTGGGQMCSLYVRNVPILETSAGGRHIAVYRHLILTS